ncbi:MAG: hypothetical protein M1157_02835 [Deinococcus sp.]|nr:hypothetical protein [Deinococcus sp.]
MDEILLLTNGPGELSTWVPPVLQRLRGRLPNTRVELFLVRDQFATGTEEEKARELPLDQLSGRKELFQRFYSKQRAAKGMVLMLGGAPRDAVWLGRACRYPAYAYSFNGKAWHRGLKAFLLDSEASRRMALQKGADPSRLRVVGNLVVDAMADGLQQNPSSPGADVLIFPSSRPFAAKYMLGFMLAACEKLQAKVPGLTYAWVKSRLLTPEAVTEALAAKGVRDMGGVGAELTGDRIVSDGGLEVRILDESLRYAAMQKAKAALTIPGTSTLEMGLSNLPAAVLLPLHKPEAIPVPLEGLLHWLWYLPGGRRLRHRIIRLGESRIRYLALPNQYLGEKVYPELRGIFGPEQVAETLAELLQPARQAAIRQKLAGLPARPGAQALVDWVLRDAQT